METHEQILSEEQMQHINDVNLNLAKDYKIVVSFSFVKLINILIHRYFYFHLVTFINMEIFS